MVCYFLNFQYFLKLQKLMYFKPENLDLKQGFLLTG